MSIIKLPHNMSSKADTSSLPDHNIKYPYIASCTPFVLKSINDNNYDSLYLKNIFNNNPNPHLIMMILSIITIICH